MLLPAAGLSAQERAAQDQAAQEQGERILLDTGIVKRPAGASANVRPVQYKSLVASTPATPRKTSANAETTTDVGVTFWRLRPVMPGDDPATRLLLLDDESGHEIEQIAERIEAGTPLKPGERVRLSVEVPRSGYLYVLDREQYANGSLGPATLIYPNFQTRPGDNQVAVGRLLEIPDRLDRISSFKLIKSGAEHQGEVLIVLVTPQPLPDLHAVGRKAMILPDEQVAQWDKQYGFQVEHLELVGGAGKPMTVAEVRAGADRNRQLTTDDAQPQSVYRVAAKAGSPILLKLPLKIRP